MDTHRGQIVEMVIRREGYSISELARLAKVNRRSIYYWFNQQYLKTEIIYQIGIYIKHDFSIEFPHIFKPDDFKHLSTFNSLNIVKDVSQRQQDAEYWKNKYLEILEKYNDLLVRTADWYASESGTENNSIVS
ncbi:helix-turn-helix domain-containing protein [Mucilaginibacter sp. X5P1]|uniref:helix-turn-helix domain-containing protein n=1 Tax=Mucilaginibacter sp. X5P1 TaxID=2723088 RepID=UPI00160A567A|nr:helix-turn-helix domain-containing protein [Mucilaginibacter sp. X5P1]MBB6137209.1 putative transcriptional regulator [Mucilaginibacter sp. X5P1]